MEIFSYVHHNIFNKILVKSMILLLFIYRNIRREFFMKKICVLLLSLIIIMSIIVYFSGTPLGLFFFEKPILSN